MIRLLMIIALVAVNFFALLHFISTSHKIFSFGPDDLGGMGALLGAVFGITPLAYAALLLTNNVQTKEWKTIPSNKKYLLGLNIAAVLFVLCLNLLLPWFSDGAYGKGYKLYQQDKLNSAIKYFNKSIYQHPDNSKALLMLAIIYEEIKDDEKAKQFYSMVIRSDSPSERSIGLNNLARLYLENNEHDEAIELLHHAWTKLWGTVAQPDENELGIISKNLAWAYWVVQDKVQAEKHLQNIRYADTLAREGYPEIYCLQALLSQEQAQADKFVKKCGKGFDRTEGMNSLDIRLLREARKQWVK